MLTLLFLTYFKPVATFSQTKSYNAIRLSRISYVHHSSGTIEKQALIDLENNKLYFRKNNKRPFREFQTTQLTSPFADSLNLSRIKAISQSCAGNSPLCTYHNEYGCYRIELILLDNKEEVYTESFLINNPYECLDKTDQSLVRAYLELIQELLNQH